MTRIDDHASRAAAGGAPLELGVPGYLYADLGDPRRLADLLADFDQHLATHAPATRARFDAYRSCGGEGMSPQAVSEVLVETAPFVGAFVARLFRVEAEWAAQGAAIVDEDATILAFRSNIVMKIASRFKGVDTGGWDRDGVRRRMRALAELAREDVARAADDEYVTARLCRDFQGLTAGDAEAAAGHPVIGTWRARLRKTDAALFADALALGEDLAFARAIYTSCEQWCYLALHDPADRAAVAGWVSFREPEKTDVEALVPHIEQHHEHHRAWAGVPRLRRRRDGFALTDRRFGQRRVLYEIDHCIYCHDRDTDSCSKGMRNRKDGSYKINALGVTVTGCPLDEKISEMHLVKRRGDGIGALALVMIDNPMCPGTGHRICNDCMKGCIYQKTEPVNIPQIETRVLTDVLFMPWGFEIYNLLTRWNPLNIRRPHALPYNGKKALIVGLGPAGYTLAHFLSNEGFGVVGIDALKIEPLPVELTGAAGTPPQPIRDFAAIYDDLDKRILAGFGGVAEYGITVRWDKNFLKVIYLTLMRRANFAIHGGVRFGGTVTIDDAWALGFDHIAIATGAGKPTVVGMKNNLVRGIRKASDFLMALQLTGAAKTASMSQLQVRLPAGVIGGGLTAIDTATELMAYYPRQVEKILHRYATLAARIGEDAVRARFDAEERQILEEYLTHGRAIAAERARAAAVGEAPEFAPLVRQWGGVTLFYRKGIKDSPAYRQNHEEIREALAESIEIAEGMNPIEARTDAHGALCAVRFERLAAHQGRWETAGEPVELTLRSLFVAAGTSPNTIYEQEHPGTFMMDGRFFQRHEPDFSDGKLVLRPMHDGGGPKIARPAPFTSYCQDGRYITFYGDNHPVYAGNVVKAMASARDGYPYVVRLFADELRQLDAAHQGERDAELAGFFRDLRDRLTATVVAVHRLTPNIIEVVVRAPMAARKFQPGQFYRVQNLESLAPVVEGTALAAEGIALTGASVDKERGLVSLIALEMGTSSRLCAHWQPGDPIILMGVTGSPTEIPHGRNVLLIGGGLGNAVLFSIGQALRTAGNRVVYFAGYKRPQDVFKVEEIERASDVVVWSVDPGPEVTPITPTRPHDKTFVGNIIESMLAYARGELGAVDIPFETIDHLIVIGSDRMMAAVKASRKTVLAPYLRADHAAIASINSPMQCMMKGVCAQCLCKHVDPDTGKESFVFSCYNQDQKLDHVDFANLNARLRQNSVQEKLANLWLDYLFERSGAA